MCLAQFACNALTEGQVFDSQLLSLLLAATHGAYGLGWRDIALGPALWLGLSDADQASAGAQVFWHIRAPRLAMGALAGMALGLAGALIQGHTRNPIADPGMLGVNAGAACAVVCGVYVLGISSPMAFMGFGLLGAIVASCAVFGVSALTGTGPVTLILAGTGLSAMLTAITSAGATATSSTPSTTPMTTPKEPT